MSVRFILMEQFVLERTDVGARAPQQAGPSQRRSATWGGSKDAASVQASASGGSLPP
jgi:hypothetical protein